MAKQWNNKRGRPFKKVKDRRGRIVTLRLTSPEHRQLFADVKAAGVSISRYLIACWEKARKCP